MNHIQQAQKKEIDTLWEKHCLQGDEINPTDTMFYEQFHDACNALIKATERATEERIVGEIEKSIHSATSSQVGAYKHIINLINK